ncbi:MAG: hypothetical protein F6K30_20485 [Cyanothece sp. SIO2G6]|nr:hypothetical protein [Cyanothece sp. SIO2G6]
MKFNAAFFTSLFNLSGSTTRSTQALKPTNMFHQYLAEVFNDTQWPRLFTRIRMFNLQGLKVVIEQGLFVVVVISVLALLIFNGILWLNPGLRDTIIAQQYTDQPQTYTSPGYNQSSGQSPSISFSQRLYTP